MYVFNVASYQSFPEVQKFSFPLALVVASSYSKFSKHDLFCVNPCSFLLAEVLNRSSLSCFYFFSIFLLHLCFCKKKKDCRILMLLINFLHIPGVSSVISTGVTPCPFLGYFFWTDQILCIVLFISKVTNLKIFGFHCCFVTQYFPLPMQDTLFCSFQILLRVVVLNFSGLTSSAYCPLLAFSILQLN